MLRSVTGRVLIHSAYGVDVKERADPIIVAAERGLEASIAAMNPGQFLVDIIPICERSSLIPLKFSSFSSSEVCSCMASWSGLPEASKDLEDVR